MKNYIKSTIILSGLLFTYSAFADVMHQVKPGDTLKSISQTYYGDDSHEQDIYQKNQSIIPKTQELKTGQTLIIPDKKQIEPAPEQKSPSTQRTEEGLPLLLDLSSTEPPDPWCCCVDSSSKITPTEEAQAAPEEKREGNN